MCSVPISLKVMSPCKSSNVLGITVQATTLESTLQTTVLRSTVQATAYYILRKRFYCGAHKNINVHFHIFWMSLCEFYVWWVINPSNFEPQNPFPGIFRISLLHSGGICNPFSGEYCILYYLCNFFRVALFLNPWFLFMHLRNAFACLLRNPPC